MLSLDFADRNVLDMAWDRLYYYRHSHMTVARPALGFFGAEKVVSSKRLDFVISAATACFVKFVMSDAENPIGAGLARKTRTGN